MQHRFIGDIGGQRDRFGYLLPDALPAEPAPVDDARDIPTLAEWVAAGYLPEAYERRFSVELGGLSLGAGIDAL